MSQKFIKKEKNQSKNNFDFIELHEKFSVYYLKILYMIEKSYN